MDITQLPPIEFREIRTTAAIYLEADVKKGTAADRLRNWRPSGPKKANPLPEDDEPDRSITCGIENPFSGVCEVEDPEEIVGVDISHRAGLWECTRSVSHHFHKSIFGKGYCRLKSLEREYNCSIEVPDIDTIGMTSKSKASLVRLIAHLEEACDPSKLKFTHFICLPLIGSAEVLSSLRSLQKQQTDPLIRDSFIQAEKLHFTVCMLKLITRAEVDSVKTILEGYRDYFHKSNGLSVELRGLRIMGGAPADRAQVVVTGGVDPSTGLNSWQTSIAQLSSKVVGDLKQAGFIDSTKQKSYMTETAENLHATIMHIKYANQLNGLVESDSDDTNAPTNSNGSHVPNGMNHTTSMNCVDLLRKFGQFHFGTVQVNQLRLCSLLDSHSLPDPDRFYTTETIVHI